MIVVYEGCDDDGDSCLYVIDLEDDFSGIHYQCLHTLAEFLTEILNPKFDGQVSIKDGIATLPDGSAFELLTD